MLDIAEFLASCKLIVVVDDNGELSEAYKLLNRCGIYDCIDSRADNGVFPCYIYSRDDDKVIIGDRNELLGLYDEISLESFEIALKKQFGTIVDG